MGWVGRLRAGARSPRPWLWLLVPLLLWLAFRRIDPALLLTAFSELTAFELVILTVVNLVALLAMAGRWWLILRGQGFKVPYLRLSLIRLAGFGWSYFTPGPQFGGEPLQIHLLAAGEGMKQAEATGSVALDKSIEVMVNFAFLLFGLTVTLRVGLLPGRTLLPVAAGALLLLALPIGLLLAAQRGLRPFGWLVAQLPERLTNWSIVGNLTNLGREAESVVVEFLQTRPGGLRGPLMASLLTWLILVAEYWLMSRFLGLGLSVWTAISVLTAARLAFLLPSPGGLGTLEASQILTLVALGQPPEVGAALALLIRGRDVVFGGIGLLAGGLLAPDRSVREGR